MIYYDKKVIYYDTIEKLWYHSSARFQMSEARIPLPLLLNLLLTSSPLECELRTTGPAGPQLCAALTRVPSLNIKTITQGRPSLSHGMGATRSTVTRHHDSPFAIRHSPLATRQHDSDSKLKRSTYGPRAPQWTLVAVQLSHEVCTAMMIHWHCSTLTDVGYPFWSLISLGPRAVKHEGFRHCSGVAVAREVGWCRLKFDSFNI